VSTGAQDSLQHVTAKKTRRRGSGGQEAEARKQQRLEARRRERERASVVERRRRRRDRLIRQALLVVAGTVGVWLVFVRSQSPLEFRGHEVEELGTSGVQEHTQGDVDYESTPPVSGPHAPTPANCGTHAKPIPDEIQVHNLEHGAIGIQYRTDADPRDIRRIESLVREYDSHVFSAPYPGMESAVAVTSWGRLMRLDSLDEGAVRDYIEEFRAQGPEKQDCDNIEKESFDASSR
jgi:Protein of unknown function (DUF3105)